MTYANAENPYSKSDSTWINIEGQVHEVNSNAFTLDYGQGLIVVEMDDSDRDSEDYLLKKGDEVNVSGIIDDGFYNAARIEASSVFLERTGSYFFASGVDEDDAIVSTDQYFESDTVVQGTVTSVSDTEFTLDTDNRTLTVEVDEMVYDPLDDEGDLQLEVGDRVTVTGNMDAEFINDQLFRAESVTTMM
ncbi:MAG TPA: DUF5666 domain-containing protein [Saccharospirillum sp.]|nr:DUF5666 domain-containing protein [Saccharospirillum sp.]